MRNQFEKNKWTKFSMALTVWLYMFPLTMWHIRISIRINTSWNLIHVSVKKSMFFSGGTIFSFLQRTCTQIIILSLLIFRILYLINVFFFIKKTEMFFNKKGNHFCYWLCNINKLILEQVNFHKTHVAVQRESK